MEMDILCRQHHRLHNICEIKNTGHDIYLMLENGKNRPVYLCNSKVKGTQNRRRLEEELHAKLLDRQTNGGLQLHTCLSLRRKRHSDGCQ